MNKNNLYILIIFCFIFIKIQIIGRQNLVGKLDNFNSKQWKPDEAFINFENNTVYIVEKKWQETEGSVDEKLLGFGNKRRLYQRLLDKAENSFAVQFIFVGNSSFFWQG